MNWKRPVIIWTSHNPNKEVLNAQEDSSVQEQAATIEETFSEPKFPIEFGNKQNLLQKKSKLQVLLVATVSAIVLGFIFGAVMLKMLTAFESGSDTKMTTAEQARSAAAGKSVLLTAFVLQGGVFAEKENAGEWLEKYKKKDIPAVLWEQGGNYYLFAGAAPAENQALNQAKKLKAEKLDIYVKEWTAPIAKGDMQANEKEWLQRFQTVWSSELQAAADGGSISVKEWKSLLSKAPNDSKNCQEISKMINGKLDKLKGAEGARAQQLLLELWKDALK